MLLYLYFKNSGGSAKKKIICSENVYRRTFVYSIICIAINYFLNACTYTLINLLFVCFFF